VGTAVKAITLYAEDLWRKFGFRDGDILGELLDDLGIHVDDEHRLLEAIIHKHLLPALHEPVEVGYIHTCHNPVRVENDDPDL